MTSLRSQRIPGRTGARPRGRADSSIRPTRPTRSTRASGRSSTTGSPSTSRCCSPSRARPRNRNAGREGSTGRAATVARVSLVFFAVFYTAWEVMVGLATGLLTKYANGLPAAEQAGAAGAIEDLNGHWVTQVTLTLGSLGWIVAVVAVAVAVRGIGAGWPAVVLLGLSATFAIHPPPVGPVALVCFVAGALLAERARSRGPAVSARKLRGTRRRRRSRPRSASGGTDLRRSPRPAPNHMARAGLEPATPRFSAVCSTN